MKWKLSGKGLTPTRSDFPVHWCNMKTKWHVGQRVKDDAQWGRIAEDGTVVDVRGLKIPLGIL